MSVKPFRFRLKKVSSRQQRLLDAVMSFLPKTGLRARFQRGVEEAMTKHVGEPVLYQLEAVSEVTHQAFVRQLPSTPVVAVVSCVPVDRKAYLQIDNIIAQVLIDRLLGGSIGEVPIPRALTDTEQGVLQYLLLQLMAHVYRLSGQSARVHFRFDRFALQPDALTELADADERVTVLTVRVQVGPAAGFVKLVIPNPLAEANFLDVSAPRERRDEELAYELGEFARFGSFRARLWVEAGRTTLTPEELMQLERDDVILFDESDIVLGDNNELGGRALIRLGTGTHGGYNAKITSDRKRVHCWLEE